MDDEAIQAAAEIPNGKLKCGHNPSNIPHCHICQLIIVVADLLRAWEMRGLKQATGLMCERCRAAMPYKITSSLRWLHPGGQCEAGPVHDAIAVGEG